MNRLTLILIACALLVAALFLTHDDGAVVARTRAGNAFLPELAAKVNDATTLTIAKNDESVELELRDGDWVVASRDGYPAKFDAVRPLLVSLARLTDAEPRTAQKERLVELTLADEGDSAGTRVTVEGKGGELLADLVVGKSRWQPTPAVYLRHAGEDQSYLLEGSVRAQTQITTWLDTSIVKWPAVDVAELAIDGDVTARLARDETNAIVLEEGLPEGRAIKTPSPFNALFGVLARLDFQDVGTAGKAPGAPVRTLTFTTVDEGAIVLRLFEDGDDVWARLEAKPSVVTPSPPTSDSVAGPPAPDAADEADVAPPAPKITPEQADTWNTAWGPWAFKLPSYRTTTLLATWDDWLEPLPEPEPEPEATPELLTPPSVDE
jgi:hypothetical protein